MIVHILFVVKYWVLSRKIFQVVTKQEDKYLETKARVLFAGLMLWIVIDFTLDVTFMAKDTYSHMSDTSKTIIKL